MNQAQETCGIPQNLRTADAPASNVSGLTPTLDERLELVRAFQAEAMRRSDALAANHAIIIGDLMKFAHHLQHFADKALSQLPVSSEGFQKLRAWMEEYLKVIRQTDRLIQIDRQWFGTSKPAPAE